MITSGELWASSIIFLNDFSEFDHAKEVMERWILRNQSQLTIVEATIARAIFTHIVHPVFAYKGQSTFVVSFSRAVDDLSQWRAYGGKGGYSLGFSLSTLKRIAAKRRFEVVRCIYSDLQKDAAMNKLMIEGIALCKSIGGTADEWQTLTYSVPDRYERFMPAIKEFSGKFYRLAARIKHSAFEAEDEVRLVSMENVNLDNRDFRVSGTLLTPFYRLRLNDKYLPVKQVYVGPSREQDLNLIAAYDFLRSKGIKAMISESQVPFRN